MHQQKLACRHYLDGGISVNRPANTFKKMTEDKNNIAMSVFHQVCEVNDLDPQAITAEAQERFPERFKDGQDVEKLIWSALDKRARALAGMMAHTLKGDKQEYTIDGDPAAPSFVINEENIRSHYSAEKAEKIIEISLLGSKPRFISLEVNWKLPCLYL